MIRVANRGYIHETDRDRSYRWKSVQYLPEPRRRYSEPSYEPAPVEPSPTIEPLTAPTVMEPPPQVVIDPPPG